MSGSYTIESNGSLDTYGYLYINSFVRVFWMQNLLASNDDDGEHPNFAINYVLQSMTKYILVTTTYYPNKTGTFSIIANGPGVVNFTHVNISGISY